VPNAFRFRPRYRALALSTLGLGGTLAVVALTVLGAAVVPLVTGAAGVLLGGAYLSSPTWKLEVLADDAGLKVRSTNGTMKLELAWSEVVAVVASPSTHTCFVDGGTPAKSLLVPGVGAPAPYAIANQDALYDAILAHVDPAKVKTVDLLEKAR
jgi:hypothetical protein